MFLKIQEKLCVFELQKPVFIGLKLGAGFSNPLWVPSSSRDSMNF